MAALTKSCRATIVKRIQGDPAFSRALYAGAQHRTLSQTDRAQLAAMLKA